MFGSKKQKKEPEAKKKIEKKASVKKKTKNQTPENPLGLDDDVKAPPKKITSFNEKSSISKIDTFMRRNSYITLIAIIFTFFYLNSKLGTLADVVERTLVQNTHYIKENIGKPIFLSANGIILTSKKSEMSLYDERFKTYLTNILVENSFQGLVKLSENFQVVFKNSNELYEKNKKLKTLRDRFFTPNTAGAKEFSKLLYQYIIEDKLPQYVDVLSTKIKDYYVREKGKEGLGREFSLNIEVKVITKSWIKAIGDYDTLTSTVFIKTKGVIDIEKYANIGNPFGVKFLSVTIPVMKKRTAMQITQEGV